MFEGDLTSLSTADLLESVGEHRAEGNRIDARVLEHAQVYADRYHPDVCTDRPGRRSCDGRERAVVLGGDGCPPIAEFAVAEFGVLLGVSPRVAGDFIGQALALRHRFPFTWARVQAGDATPWKARQVVQACIKLSEAAAAHVDKRVAPLIDSITPYRLDKIVRAAKLHADPALAKAEADQVARERGVYVGSSDDHGTKTMFIRAAAGAVTRHNATLSRIADALQTFGDTRPVQRRRAEAVGIIADPAYAQELLAQARRRASSPTADPRTDQTGSDSTRAAVTESAGYAPAGPVEPIATDAHLRDDDLLDDEADRDAPHPSDLAVPDPLDTPHGVSVEPLYPADPEPGDGDPVDAAALRVLYAHLAQIRQDAHTQPAHTCTRRQTEIYVHLTDHTLATGTGVLRAEGIGPILASQLSELVGYGPYTVKPVVDLNDAVSVDAYEIPDRIRERVKLIHPAEVFPYGSRETTRTMDLDHVQPYDPLGPPGQTNTHNLAPLGRFTHRVKTHAHGWNVRRLDPKPLSGQHPTASSSRSAPPELTEYMHRAQRWTRVERPNRQTRLDRRQARSPQTVVRRARQGCDQPP